MAGKFSIKFAILIAIIFFVAVFGSGKSSHLLPNQVDFVNFYFTNLFFKTIFRFYNSKSEKYLKEKHFYLYTNVKFEF